jgi:antitoxin Phd
MPQSQGCVTVRAARIATRQLRCRAGWPLNVQFVQNVQNVYNSGMPTQTTGSAASTVTFRNRDGRLVDVPTVSATRLRNEFGTVFEQATVDGAVLITKHDAPKAVLLSYAEFEALTKSATPVLDDLSERFDELLATMQTPEAKAGVAAAFNATPQELGAAAVKAARANRRR